MRRLLLWGVLGLALIWAAALVVAPAIVYVAGSYLCHQRPERSFWIGDRPLPVCARCTGLYLAAPLGLAFAALSRPRRRDMAPVDRTYAWWRVVLLAAAVPTVASVGIEWVSGLSGNASRALTAIPLGMAVAGLIGAALRGDFAEAGS